jgi:cellulose synthase/poly-beta-1,6-N-acetylglucosamine synthase-like glycosyltransferase
MAMFLLFAAVIFGVLSLHPFITYPLSLMLARRLFGKRWVLHKQPEAVEADVSCAICLCAYNEARTIREKIESLLELKPVLSADHIQISIHVYTDGCSDDTAAIVESFGDRVRRVVSPKRTGKSAGMNSLLSEVRDQFVIFTDANVIFDRDAIANLLLRFDDPAVGCVVGNLKYTNDGETPTATTGSLYWRFEEFLKQLESDTGSVMGADGSIFAIRRILFREVPADIIDDMFTSMSIVCDSYRAVRAVDAVAYERSATSSSDEFRRKVRIACRCFNCHRLLLPRLRRMGIWNVYKYTSHKLLRWFVVYFAAAAFVCLLSGVTLMDRIWGLSLLGAVILGLVAILSMSRLRIVNCGLQAVMAFYAVGKGVLHSLRGERFITWEPPASSRG